MIKKIGFMILCSLLAIGAQAQTVKDIAVSGKEPFTDHVSLKSDAHDMDIIVKFVFNESDESLTLSLISYRSLFVFREDVRYKQVKSAWSSKLKVDRFPYVVAAGKEQQFRLAPTLNRSFPKPRSKYIFHRWLDYDGLIPQPAEYKMVNDVIEQKFNIKNKQNAVTVSLRDVFLMDRDARREQTYWLVYGRDLNTNYRITLQRDPCLGREQEIQDAQKMVADLQKAYRNFQTKYKRGVVNTQEHLATFKDTKERLLQQFPQRTVTSPCTDLQAQWDQYQNCLDSLSAMTCRLDEPQAPAAAEVTGPRMKDTSAALLLAKAHRIDAIVAQWQLSDDQVECSELRKACRILIVEGNNLIMQNKAVTPEQQRAVKLFREAEKHFKQTCRF